MYRNRLGIPFKGVGLALRAQGYGVYPTEEGKEEEGEQKREEWEGGEGREKGRSSVGDYLSGERDHRTADN